MAQRNILIFTGLMTMVVGIATAAPPTDNMLQTAHVAIRVKDYATALAKLRPLATAGNADAEYLLGSMYRNGLGVDIDNGVALKWIRSAAAHGSTDAAYSLAALLAADFRKNQAEIQTLLQQAAKGGHVLASKALTTGSIPLQFRPEKSLTDAALRRTVLFNAAQQDDVDVIAVFSDSELKMTDDFGRSALAHAALRGASRAVELLLQHGAPVNQTDAYSITPLMLAASAGQAAVATQLLTAKANIDAQDKAGNTALMYALAYKRVPVAKSLMTVGNVRAVNAQNWTALDWAVHSDAQEIVVALKALGMTSTHKSAISTATVSLPLLHAGANDLYKGWPDLTIAASRPSTELLGTILKSTNANAVNAAGDSALLIAVRSGNTQQVEQLLNAGASVAVTATMNETPLSWAVRHNQASIVQQLLAHSANPNIAGKNEHAPLLDAVQAHNEVIIKALLKAVARTDVRDVEGRTPLMIAAMQNQPAVISALLASAAEVDGLDTKGRSALWYASAMGAGDSIKSLMTAKPAVDKRDKNGMSPLMIAAANGQRAAVELLLAAGASAQGSDKGAVLPLQLGAVSGNEVIVSKLLAAGAQLDAQNKFGDTALISAVRAGQLAAAATLLKAGANVDLRNKDRATARDVANALGFKELQALLEKHG